MELQTRAFSSQTSAVLPLPFVKLDPNNPNAIYTSLDYAVTDAKNHGQQHCSVTFDHPFFGKLWILFIRRKAPVFYAVSLSDWEDFTY